VYERTGSVPISSLLNLPATMNTSPNKRPAMDTWIERPAWKKMCYGDLGRVADMMDVWTRDENTAYAKENEEKGVLLLKMTDEIIRLTDQLGARNRFIAEISEDNARLVEIVEMERVASVGMQNIILADQRQLNGLMPERRFTHVMATDMLGVVHACMVQRQDFEMVDLTGDVTEGDTTELESDEDLELLFSDM
jgi:hypothetical protein